MRSFTFFKKKSPETEEICIELKSPLLNEECAVVSENTESTPEWLKTLLLTIQEKPPIMTNRGKTRLINANQYNQNYKDAVKAIEIAMNDTLLHIKNVLSPQDSKNIYLFKNEAPYANDQIRAYYNAIYPDNHERDVAMIKDYNTLFNHILSVSATVKKHMKKFDLTEYDQLSIESAVKTIADKMLLLAFHSIELLLEPQLPAPIPLKC